MPTRRGVVGSLALGWRFLATPAWAEQPPHVPHMVWPMLGDSWTYRQTVYVDGIAQNHSQFRVRRIRDAEFRNEPCIVYEMGRARALLDSENRLVAKFIGDQLTEISEVREDFVIWPMRVGTKWRSRLITKGPSGNILLNLNVLRTIEAFEPVTTPAGVFDAFKIRRDHEEGFLINWWEPKRGIDVRKLGSLPGRNSKPMLLEFILVPPPAIS